jgi:hypothetical protein
MCDWGRLNTFKHVQTPGRIKAPLVKKGDEFVEVGWDEAIALVASGLKAFKKSELAAIGSAYATNEENYLLQKFASEALGTKHIGFMQHIVEGEQDEILIRSDRTPNSVGAREVGVSPREGGMNFEAIVDGINRGQILEPNGLGVVGEGHLINAVDGFELGTVPPMRRLEWARYEATFPQKAPLNCVRRYEDIRGLGVKMILRGPQEAESLLRDFQIT